MSHQIHGISAATVGLVSVGVREESGTETAVGLGDNQYEVLYRALKYIGTSQSTIGSQNKIYMD